MRPDTLAARQRLYLLARVVIARHYRRELTLPVVARALACSPRQLQRAFAEFGEHSFSEELLARRLSVGAQLLVEQRSIPVADVARLVGYSQGTHFAKAFRRRYGRSPANFREAARRAGVRAPGGAGAVGQAAARPSDTARPPAVAARQTDVRS
jgi:AraC-like DNA-binding protein